MRRLTSAVVIGCCVYGAVSLAHTFQRPGETLVPSALVMGVVVDALDNQPIPHSEVSLGGAPPAVRNTRVLTDAEGRFVFMDLPGGTYTITAAKPGYADGAYGRRRPLGLSQSLELADAERIGDIRIPAWKFAAVTGRVTDEAGEPMVGIAVQVLSRTVIAGKQKLTPGAVGVTDDRGVYRISSLTPGEYAVVVPSTQAAAPQSVVDLFAQLRMTPLTKPGEPTLTRDLSFSGGGDALNQFQRNNGTRVGTMAFVSSASGMRAGVAPAPGDGRLHVYPSRYYPSVATAAEAMRITLGSGEERAGVDVQVMLVPTSRVSGTVTGPDGPALASMSLVPDSDDLSTEVGLEVATTLSDRDGRFTFLGVPEGRYRLRAVWANVPATGTGSRGAPPPARPPGTGAPATPPRPALGGFTLWATDTIDVGDTDIADLAITLHNGFRVSGRAEFTGAKSQPLPDELRRMSVTFDPADARPLVSATIGRGQFDDGGFLSSYQLPPGRYYVRVNAVPAGWTLQSAMLNGRDISNVPVVLDRDAGGLTITFTDRPSSLSGQVVGTSGAPDGSATVLVFPEDAAAWTDYGGFPRRLRSVRAGKDGKFETLGLPAGDYLVAAVAEESSANWQDPVVLKALSRQATSVAVTEGESRSVALRTVAVQR